MATLTRSLLIRGPAKFTFGGATFYTEDDIECPLAPVLTPLNISALGTVDQIKTDMILNINLRPFGARENLTVLFPSAFLTATPGSTVFGTAADTPLVIIGRNGDQITYHNVRVTKMSDLFLGVDSQIFSSAVTFTALLKTSGGSGATNVDTSTANAYYTIATGASYGNDADFSTSIGNYRREAYTAVWGTVAGYTAFQCDKGVNLAWSMGLTPHYNSNFGTVDYIINDIAVTARAIPLQGTIAQMETAGAYQGNALGARASSVQPASDLTFTGTSGTFAFKINSAVLVDHGLVFGQVPLRVREHTWMSVRRVAGGALDPVVVITP